MEYMTEDQVRTLLAAEGSSAVQIDALIDAARKNAAIAAITQFRENMEALAAALSAFNDAFMHDMEQLAEQLAGINYTTPPKLVPRPPRYAGPINKGTQYTQRPPRVARSCCRKMRR